MSLWWPQFDDVHDWLIERGFASRDWGLLAASLDRPLTTLAGQELYPTIWEKLAALLDSIERNHPLIDGNKRLGFLLTSLILNANGMSDHHVTDDDWFELIMDVAANHPEVSPLAKRLQSLVEGS